VRRRMFGIDIAESLLARIGWFGSAA